MKKTQVRVSILIPSAVELFPARTSVALAFNNTMKADAIVMWKRGKSTPNAYLSQLIAAYEREQEKLSCSKD